MIAIVTSKRPFHIVLILMIFSSLSEAQQNVITKRDLEKFPMALLDGESVSLYASLAIARKADPNRSSFDRVGPMSAADAMTELWSAEKNFRGNRPWTSLMVVDRVLKPYRNQGYENLDNTLLHVIARAFGDRGIMNHHMGLLSKAEKATKIALELRTTRFGKNHIATIVSLNNLGALYKDMGKYAEAERIFTDALLQLKQTGRVNSMERAIVLNNQSMLFLSLGRLKEAEKLLQVATVIADDFKGSKSKDFLPFRVNNALIQWSKNDLGKAAEILTEVKNIKEKRFGKKTTQYARALNHLAAIKMESGDKSEVEGYLNTALTIYKKVFGENHPTTANIMGNLGRYFLITQQYKRAEEQLIKAKKLQSYILNKYHPDYLLTVESLALSYAENGKTDLAKEEFEILQKSLLEQIENYFPALSEEEKTKFWDQSRPFLMSYFTFITDNIDEHPTWASDMYAMHLATKGLLFDTTIGIRREILSSGKPELIEKYLKWLDLKEGLVKYYTLPKNQLFAMGINLLNEEKKINTLEKELSLASFKFSSAFSKKTPDFRDIQSKISSEEVLVEVIRLVDEQRKPQYAAFILKSDDDFPRLIKIKNGEDLEGKFLNYYRSSIKFQTKDELSYNNYWSPIAKSINNKEKVYLSLDGVYNQVSIPTLLSDDGGYIIDDKNIEFISSGKQLMETKLKTELQTSVLIGNPKFADANVSKLPATKVEVEEIGLLMKENNLTTSVLVESNATEQQIKSSVDPSVLHFATHGFFLEDTELGKQSSFGLHVPSAVKNPLLRSGLILAAEGDSENNGILTAHEAMNLKLNNTQLVVLSACETGLGEIKVGEGVYGLQRAFQVAGADAVVVSLWQVDDKATQELMTAFYTGWLNGETANQALINAQKKVRETYPEPYFWGAFILLN